MAIDIIFGRTRRNWARGIAAPSTTGLSDEVTLRLTEPEIAMLAELAATRARADAGDGASRKKLKKLASRVTDLERRASRGDSSSARTLLVLRESGVLRTIQPVVMGGRVRQAPVRRLASVAGSNQVSNTSYRVAVLRQARRVAGGRPPTTSDFVRAKARVDGAMRQSGVSLHIPGSRPGRITR